MASGSASRAALGPGRAHSSLMAGMAPSVQPPGRGGVFGSLVAVVLVVSPAGLSPARSRSCWYWPIHLVWYWRGVSVLPAPGTGTLSHSGEPGAGSWPRYQVTGMALTRPLEAARISLTWAVAAASWSGGDASQAAG